MLLCRCCRNRARRRIRSSASSRARHIFSAVCTSADWNSVRQWLPRMLRSQMYVARSRAGCEYTAADPIIRERPTRSLHRQCLGSNRPSVTRYTALLGLTPREHARALHAALRFCARRTDGGRRSPSCGTIGNFLA